jgi:hypothetical protein
MEDLKTLIRGVPDFLKGRKKLGGADIFSFLQ